MYEVSMKINTIIIDIIHYHYIPYNHSYISLIC